MKNYWLDKDLIGSITISFSMRVEGDTIYLRMGDSEPIPVASFNEDDRTYIEATVARFNKMKYDTTVDITGLRSLKPLENNGQ